MWIILWKNYIQQWQSKTYDIEHIEQKCPIPSPKNNASVEEEFDSPVKKIHKISPTPLQIPTEIITIPDTQEDEPDEENSGLVTTGPYLGHNFIRIATFLNNQKEVKHNQIL